MSFSQIRAYRTSQPNGIIEFKVVAVAKFLSTDIAEKANSDLPQLLLENLVERLKDDVARLRVENLVWEEK